MRKFFAFIFSLLIAASAFARVSTEAVAEFSSEFREILVDVRGSRGGNGDVAAGYLTVMDLLRHQGFKSRVTMLTDRESYRILENLAWQNKAFWSTVTVESIESLSRDKVFDMYLALAGHGGYLTYEYDINDRPFDKRHGDDSDPDAKIRVRNEGVSIGQTVLGNTEAGGVEFPRAIIRNRGVSYDMSPAGLGEGESGVYNDYVALYLKTKSVEETKAFVVANLPDVFSSWVIRSIFDGTMMKDSKFGLVYGISSNTVKSQFETYLQGLAKDSSASYCLLTPSSFELSNISSRKLRDRIVVISDLNRVPARAQPGIIYIIHTPRLTHKVFVGLMAYSMKAGLVPVGAGDGFMSAAINLGRPFVSTRVPWNEENIANLKARLMSIAERSVGQRDKGALKEIEKTLSRIYDRIDLQFAQRLQQWPELFETLSQEVPDLSESLMAAALKVKNQPPRESPEFTEFVKNIPDPVLGASLLEGKRLETVTVKKIRSLKSTLKGIWPKVLALLKFDFKKSGPSNSGTTVSLPKGSQPQLCVGLFAGAK